MPDRTINFGDDEADARYRIQDTSSTGGDLVLAEDLDGGTVLLEYDYSASEWVSRGPVNLNGNDITNAGSISADALEAGSVNTDRAYTESRAAKIVVHTDGTNYYADGADGEIESGTDAATVLQAAIDALPDQGNPPQGGKIYVKAGNYQITSTVSLGVKPVTIQGENQLSTQFTQKADIARLFESDSGECHWQSFRDVKMHGNKTDYSQGIGWYCGSNVQDVGLFNVGLKKFQDDGVQTQETRGWRVQTSYFEQCGRHGFHDTGGGGLGEFMMSRYANNGSAGLRLLGSQNRVIGNEFQDNGTYGVDSGGDANLMVGGWYHGDSDANINIRGPASDNAVGWNQFEGDGTTTNAVLIGNSPDNIIGPNQYSGHTGQKINDGGVRTLINGEATQSDTTEEPAASPGPGYAALPVWVRYTDTDDGSGSGIYYIDRTETVHGPI